MLTIDNLIRREKKAMFSPSNPRIRFNCVNCQLSPARQTYVEWLGVTDIMLCGFNESYVANTSEEYTARTISFTTLC